MHWIEDRDMLEMLDSVIRSEFLQKIINNYRRKQARIERIMILPGIVILNLVYRGGEELYIRRIEAKNSNGVTWQEYESMEDFDAKYSSRKEKEPIEGLYKEQVEGLYEES